MSKLTKYLKKNLNFLNPLNPIRLEDFVFFVLVIFFFIALISIYIVSIRDQGEIFNQSPFYSLTNIVLSLRILLIAFIYIIIAQRYTALKRPRLGILLASIGILSYFFIYPVLSVFIYFYLPAVIILVVTLEPYESKKLSKHIRHKKVRSKRPSSNPRLDD